MRSGPLPKEFKNSLGMEFVLVPKGKSWLGGGGGKPGEQEVEIKEDFYLGKYEVTQEEWLKVTGRRPSKCKVVEGVEPDEQKRFPVEYVSWVDTQEFLGLVNELTKESNWTYRLPTQVEWEYACRGGPLLRRQHSAFDFYVPEPTNILLLAQANFAPEPGKGLNRTCKVGSYPPNALGLYDMHGNVREWCEDEAKPGADGAPRRAHRGGSWNYDSRNCRAVHGVADTLSNPHVYVGLRVARVPVGKVPDSTQLKPRSGIKEIMLETMKRGLAKKVADGAASAQEKDRLIACSATCTRAHLPGEISRTG
jgi:formylglycine-generating enzyme required for sulfatase activity